MDISVYSLVALTRAALPLMPDGGNILCMTYYGAEKVVPHYNVMGVAKAALEASMRYLAADLGPQNIRVNAISAGPIKTLSAAGISGFRKMLGYVGERAPLRRNVDQDEVGQYRFVVMHRLEQRGDRRGRLCRCRLSYIGHAGTAGKMGSVIFSRKNCLCTI